MDLLFQSLVLFLDGILIGAVVRNSGGEFFLHIVEFAQVSLESGIVDFIGV